MTMFGVFLGVIVLGVWWRFRRQRMLAGRIADKPIFHVEPPARRLGARKREQL